MYSENFRVNSVFAICLLLLPFVAENKATTRINNDDLSKAFLGVTNKSGELFTLIPEMYDTGATNAPFIFKVPIKDGSEMIYMQRSDFFEPHFPVLATNYIKLMRERKQVMTAALIQEMPFKKGVSVSQIDFSAGNSMDDWYELGLDGWIGEISRPINLKTNVPSKNEQAIAIQNVRDHKLEEIVGKLLKDNKNTQDKQPYSPYNSSDRVKLIGTKMEEFKDENERNTKVYLSRANDPFGYSTNWELKNSSELSSSSPLDDNRLKRDIVTLYSMIKCSTGCDPISYKGYGCYCGFLGSGYPVNGIDTCCKLHDKCYEHSNCISYLEYFVPYVWKCYRGKPLCAIHHGKFGGPESCAARLCHCDLRLSRCLKQFSCPRQRARCQSSTARQLQNLLFF